MEWVLGGIVAAGLALVAGRRLQARTLERRHAAAALTGMRTLAEQDVAALGARLERLQSRIGEMDHESRMHHQHALDVHESALVAVTQIRSGEDVAAVTRTLAEGRYALARAEAGLAGEPDPEDRLPCFFDPAHGPSAQDVRYTNPGRGTRTVPACAGDTARVQDGEQPDVRMVEVGTRTVPYWRGGPAYRPYAAGYFLGAGRDGTNSLSWAFDPYVSTRRWRFSGRYGTALDSDVTVDHGHTSLGRQSGMSASWGGGAGGGGGGGGS